MAKVVHAQEDEEGREQSPGSEQPTPTSSACEDCESRSEKRGEQAVARVRVEEQAQHGSDHGSFSNRPALSTPRALECKKQQRDEQRLCRCFDRDSPELEEPGCEAR